MSKLSVAAATSHTLSLTAAEEASRLGERTVGVDHLFLALVVNEQVAGQVLRSLGITLDLAHAAVAAQHAAQLASLGVRSEAPAPGRITFYETNDYSLNESACEVVKRSVEGKKRGDAAAVLREVVTEPSGLIEAVLHRLGTSPDVVLARLEEVTRHPARAQHSFGPGALSSSSEGFVPADVAQVWALLCDPARMPEWEPGTGSVEGVPSRATIGSRWVSRARTEGPDGKPFDVKQERRRAVVELTDREEFSRIEWRFTWPDAPKSNMRQVRVGLEPAAGGTQLSLSIAWVRRPDAPRRIPLLRWLLRPLHRFGMWMQLMQLSGSISRVFR